MIRIVAIISLTSLLIMVFYLPAAYTPEQIVQHLHQELRASQRYWGSKPTLLMLDRALDMQTSTSDAAQLPNAHAASQPASLDAAVAREITGVHGRLFKNSYFRSIEALFSLACFRLSSMVHWLPWLLLLALPIVLDGYWHRIIQAQQFRQFDPEIFAVWTCLSIMTSCASVLALVAPIEIHPLVMPCAPVLTLGLAGLAWRSYHRR